MVKDFKDFTKISTYFKRFHKDSIDFRKEGTIYFKSDQTLETFLEFSSKIEDFLGNCMETCIFHQKNSNFLFSKTWAHGTFLRDISPILVPTQQKF